MPNCVTDLIRCCARDSPRCCWRSRTRTRPGIEALGIELGRRGVPVLLAGANAAGSILLPAIDVAAELAPILLVQSAYRMIASLAVRRGLDPDHPPHLHKITETV